MAGKTPPVERSILLVPSLVLRRGFGHLKRCLDLLKDLGDQGFIYWPKPQKGREAEYFSQAQWHEYLPNEKVIHTLDGRFFSIALLDQQTSQESLARKILDHCDVLISWDEGGSPRTWAEYLIDSLPNDQHHGPNLVNRSFLKLGKKRPFINRPVEKALISFGGADPANLTPAMIKFLKRRFHFQPQWELGVVEGPYFEKKISDEPFIKVIKSPGTMEEIWKDYDLFIGSFGLAALEAVRNGLPAVLLNPSSYHRKMARAWGFNEIGVKHPKEHLWHQALLNLSGSWEKVSKILDQGEGTMAEFLLGFSGGSGGCPVCSTRGGEVLFRHGGRSFFKCPGCSMVYMKTYNQKPVEYSQAYFFEDYQKQYGKTYLEDFPHIKAMGVNRMIHIKKFMPQGRLLDIGCAYGPFLSAAKDLGFEVEGLDISEDAAAYVRSLGIPAKAQSFLDLETPQPNWDVVTLWYVIEHFEKLEIVLRKLNGLIKNRGVLAFGTPNFTGVTGLFNSQKFFLESPWDHFSLWSPRIAKKVLKRFGFKVLKIQGTGIHPERFPWVKKKNTVTWYLAEFLSKIFCWGDTFEIYARKVRDL